MAGYPAGGTLGNGAWDGPVAGSILDIIVTFFAAPLGSLFGLAGGPPGNLLGGVSVLVAGVVLTFIFAIDSAITGTAGAWARG